MKKIALAGVVVAGIAIAGFFVFRSISAQGTSAEPGVSQRTAEVLQTKIDHIKKTSESGNTTHPGVEVEISEAELDSYVLFLLRDQIPIQMDAFHTQLTTGAVGAETQLTFTSNSTGNPMVDAFVGGTHNLSLKGKLTGEEGRGKFELEDIKVDGIPVPKVLINTLFDKYVKPKYPDANLKEPFDLPWGIRSIDIQDGRAKIVY